MGKSTIVKHVQLRDTHVLELLDIDLFGSTQTESVDGKKYALVYIDDNLRYLDRFSQEQI